MPYNNSRHHLPMSSMLFGSAPNLHRPLPTNPTLVNLQEAADTSITALPVLPKAIACKISIWHRFAAKIRGLFGKKEGRRRKEEKKAKKENVGQTREMGIGGPTSFQHLKTGGALGLRGGDGGEEEWEDV